MPRHLFSFSERVKDNIARLIDSKLMGVKQSRYENEPNFTPAMIQALEGIEYEDEECSLKVEGAVMTSVGSSSVEKPSGADCSIVATITDKSTGKKIEKDILAQCKKGSICDLPAKEGSRLKEQILKMKEIVKSPKVIETPTDDGEIPHVISGNGVLSENNVQKQSFGRWIARRVATTLDGDTSSGIKGKVLDASLSSLNLIIVKKK